MPSRLKFTDKIAFFDAVGKNRLVVVAPRGAAKYREPLRLLQSIFSGRRRRSLIGLVANALQEGR